MHPLAQQSSQEPRTGAVLCLRPEGFRRMAFVEWGPADSQKVVVCVHGLTRNGRDFDWLAQSLASHGYRVVCPDVLGRGQSDWLMDPNGYSYPLYMADMATLLARYQDCEISWIGTSMGGLLGMFLASTAQNPIKRLLMNDVGPWLGDAALQRIMEYVGKDPHFKSIGQAESYFRTVLAPFGSLSDGQWQHITAHSTKAVAEGGFRLAYDPKIAEPLRAAPPGDINLWPVWMAIQCPVMVVRGETSDLLTAPIVEQMQALRTQCQAMVVAGAGHAPLLATEEEQAAILKWLAAE